MSRGDDAKVQTGTGIQRINAFDYKGFKDSQGRISEVAGLRDRLSHY